MPTLRFIAAIWLVLGLATGAAADDDDGPMRVVVRVAGDADRQLLSRIDGQVADLDVTLIRDETGPPAATAEGQYARARVLARQQGARIVVWFEAAGPDGVRVHVAEPGRDTLFARRVATADESARAEAIAIVVRTTLQALAAGGEIGVKVPRPEPEPVIAPPSPGWRWHLGVQGQLSVDGESSPGQAGLMGRAGLSRGRVQLGVVGVVGLGDELRDEMTAVHLTRHSAGVGAGFGALRGDRGALWIGVDAGLVVHTRSTTVLGGGLEAAPPGSQVAGFAAPWVRGQWRPMADQALWLTCELAAAVVTAAPKLRYELDGMPVVRNRLWPVQPSLGLGLRLEGL